MWRAIRRSCRPCDSSKVVAAHFKPNTNGKTPALLPGFRFAMGSRFFFAITSHPDRRTGDRHTADSDQDDNSECDQIATEPVPAPARRGPGRNCMRRCDPRSPHRSHRRQRHDARASPPDSVRMRRAGYRQQPSRLEEFSWSCLSLLHNKVVPTRRLKRRALLL
jgi:hypothetical protein